MMKFSSIVLFSVGCFQLTHAKQVEISEGRKRLLTCSLGQVLNIQSAKYGGSSFGCRDNDVTSIVQSQCQNKRTCMVYAEDDHYEDSCLLSNEVLTITYRCIPKEDCYYRIFGNIYYDGTISVTESGKTCQWWDDNEPHVPKYRPNSGGQRNYCRNPDGDSDRPWCYTMDPETRWEYCDIEDCDWIATSATTKSNTVSMTTTLSYSTRWQPIETNGSVTESGNQTNVSAEKSKLTNTSSDVTITIVTLIAGCIFGLLLIGIITIAIFRRFREKRDVGGVLVLHMSSLSQENQRPVNNNISTHSNGSVLPSDTNVRNMPTSYFGNNAYSLQQSSTSLISETTTSKYVDESEHVMGDGEYTVIEQYPTDSLPPSYDSVSRNNPSAAGHSMNVYNHAHYSADDYAKSDSMGLLQQSENLSDGYCKAASLVAESTHDGCQNDPVYENENIKCNQNGRFSKCRSHVKSDNLLQKNKTSNPLKKDKGNNDIISTTENNSPSYTKKGNQYDDIDFKTSSNKSHYQNIEDSEIEVKRQHQGYMPMEFGKGGSIDETDNVYVPIMSPISKSPPIVFDDTYQF